MPSQVCTVESPLICHRKGHALQLCRALFIHKRQPEDRHLSPAIHPHTQFSSEVTEEGQVLESIAQVSPLGSYFKFSLHICPAQYLLGMKEGGTKEAIITTVMIFQQG